MREQRGAHVGERHQISAVEGASGRAMLRSPYAAQDDALGPSLDGLDPEEAGERHRLAHLPGEGLVHAPFLQRLWVDIDHHRQPVAAHRARGGREEAGCVPCERARPRGLCDELRPVTAA